MLKTSSGRSSSADSFINQIGYLTKDKPVGCSKMSMELVIGSKQEGNKTPVNQTFAVVLKHTVQIMPGITKWIQVLVQEQPRITDPGAESVILHHILQLIHRKCQSSVQNLLFHTWADLEKIFRGGEPNIVGIKLAQLNVLLKVQLRTSLVVSQIPV